MFQITRSPKLLWWFVFIATLGLISCGGGQAAVSNSPVSVQINLTEFKITSSMTTFSVGTPYHFEVTNNGNAPHEFQIMPPATGKLTQDQVNKMALAGIGQDDLPAGGSKVLDYTFTQAYPQGTLEFACHLAGHYEGGMHVPIVVNNK